MEENSNSPLPFLYPCLLPSPPVKGHRCMAVVPGVEATSGTVKFYPCLGIAANGVFFPNVANDRRGCLGLVYCGPGIILRRVSLDEAKLPLQT
ncbi:hypothetical protein AFLA_008488 [Aspergillus flavus NRRL3357]|nr:hypothetical protein AFLA_008488 [Aspergillus flavus NRRL3357]